MLQSWARWENYSFTIYIKWNLQAADSTSTNAPPGGQAGGGGIVLPDLPIPDVPTVYERQSYIMSPFGYLKVLSWVFLTMGWSFLVEEVHVIRGGNTKIEFVWITMLISWIVYRYVRASAGILAVSRPRKTDSILNSFEFIILTWSDWTQALS